MRWRFFKISAGPLQTVPTATMSAPPPKLRKRSRAMLYCLLAVSIAPVAASYMAYYVIKPQGGVSNYGTLLTPQQPLPATLVLYEGEAQAAVAAPALRGKWLMLSVDSDVCDGRCLQKLYYMRQVRMTQGEQRGRIQTVWLRTGTSKVPQAIANAYPDSRFFRADAKALAAWLPVARGTDVEDHIYLVDPNGNLMMRFPKHPDPSLIKRDLTKLLKWSGIG